MIYLIDEKKERQVSYGWPEARFNKYEGILTRITDYDQLKRISSQEILKDNNIILLHDSFFKNLSINEQDAEKFRNRIKESNQIKSYAIFGGSYSSIYISDNNLELKDDTFYKHLGQFLDSEVKNLKILAYGENYNFEEFCTIKHEVWNYLFSFNQNHILTDDEKFEIQELTNYDIRIKEILPKVSSVLNLKYDLNKWKI